MTCPLHGCVYVMSGKQALNIYGAPVPVYVCPQCEAKRCPTHGSPLPCERCEAKRQFRKEQKEKMK